MSMFERRDPLEEFEEDYPLLFEEIGERRHEYIDRDSVMVTFMDGSVKLYDVMMTDPRPMEILRFDDIRELTDDDWLCGFAYLLDREINRRGMSREEFAEELGVTKSLVTKLLNGSHRASLLLFARIVDALGCEASDLMPNKFIAYDPDR